MITTGNSLIGAETDGDSLTGLWTLPFVSEFIGKYAFYQEKMTFVFATCTDGISNDKVVSTLPNLLFKGNGLGELVTILVDGGGL
jgi:hypothetical protein